jgi:integrase
MAKEWTLAAVNGRLKQSRSVARIRDRSGRLELRATLPPKPGSDRPYPYQQEIGLRVPHNIDGLKRAEQLAMVLSAELIGGSFDWGRWMSDRKLPENKPASQWIKEFEAYYRGKKRLKERTWKKDWLEVLDDVPPDEPLTIAAIQKAIDKIPPDTKTRKDACEKWQVVSDWAKLGGNFKEHRGNYGPSKVVRDIPTDAAIVEARGRIDNPQWLWVFSMMAAYGLRPYEVFFCEWKPDGLYVPRGKSDTDRVIAESLYPEWQTDWDLRTVAKPNLNYLNLYDKGELGGRIGRQFRRMDIGFAPYDLRHAFALRGITLGLPPATTAEMMGHTLQVHIATYNKHIKASQNREVLDRVLSRSDRVKPPGAT